MRGNKLSVDRTKKEAQHERQFGKGGKTRMFKEQSAGPTAAGRTGKRETSAPGQKFARGGGKKISYSSSVPATPGITGSR
jgi:hypothetical protein